MASADDSSPDLQRAVNRQAGKLQQRLDEIRSKQGLNDAHTAAVLEMGIRSLLHLQIAELPTRMWYWLVQNYNPRNSTLYLADSIGLCITEDV
nr:hypothetical protein DM860_011472 [Ipomoea batatas]